MKHICFIVFIVVVFLSCERPDIERVNKVETANVTQSGNDVIVENFVLDVSGSGEFEYGICYVDDVDPDYNDTRTSHVGASRLEFNDTLSNVVSGKAYLLRPYIKTSEKVVYGDKKAFSFYIDDDYINIESFDFSSEEPEKIQIVANFDGFGSFMIDTFGYAYKNADASPADWINVPFQGMPAFSFQDSIYEISEGDEYNIRFYVKPVNSDTIYSEVFTFVLQPLEVFTTGSMLLGSNSVKLNGEIIQGSYDVTNYGFCYSYTTSNPSLNEEYIELGPGFASSFSADVSGLSQQTTYYYRAYALIKNQVYYGNIENFSTR
jgi:hypothetical protein